MTDYETYKLGDFRLKSGEALKDAFIAYKIFGDPTSPAIVYPTWYSGTISTNLWLIGDSLTLSPKKYFIIVPALFGNGESSSPSNTPSPRPFPRITFYDNVRAQHELVTKQLGVSHAFAVLGWSMGAAQTFQWATQYPDFMDCIAPFCGSARTSLHNQVFLEGVKGALLAAKGAPSGGVGATGKVSAASGEYQVWSKEEATVGLKAFGRVYAGWGFSQAFYREKLHEKHFGAKSLEAFLVDFWEAWALSKDPENLMTMLYTWQTGDVSQQEPYRGDFEAAMKGIKASALVLPAKTDLYFPPEDSEIEVELMGPKLAELAVFPSIWGHWAGGPGDSKEDVKWLDERLRDFFARVETVKGTSLPHRVK